jgi:hypothetical protein
VGSGKILLCRRCYTCTEFEGEETHIHVGISDAEIVAVALLELGFLDGETSGAVALRFHQLHDQH